tara:strand:+ start:1194 stop:2159 length:966 start_codon:yes stop_codon:yes gene_type:complete
MKRVAVCISGVIREPESCIPYIKSFFNELKEGAKVDYFIYTSNYSHISYEAQRINYYNDRKEDFINKEVIKLKEEEIKNYINSFEPKKYVIDDKRVKLKSLIKNYLPEKYEECKGENFKKINQYFVAEECNKLKQEYEKKHNFKYDIVFRIRPDLFLAWNPERAPKNEKEWDEFLRAGERLLPGRLNEIHVQKIDVFQGNLFVADNYFYGDSNSMDTFLNKITINTLVYFKKSLMTKSYHEDMYKKLNIKYYYHLFFTGETCWGNQINTTKCSCTPHGSNMGYFRNDIIRGPMEYISDPGKAKEKVQEVVRTIQKNLTLNL